MLAAFRHLKGIVSVMSPDRMPEVMNNLAAAATQLDPHVMMQMMQTEDDPDAGGAARARPRRRPSTTRRWRSCWRPRWRSKASASDRLATIFNTIAPDEDRKRRVLTMTRTMLSETDFGKTGQFQVLWTSMEELLISYNDKPFVSESYRNARSTASAAAPSGWRRRRPAPGAGRAGWTRSARTTSARCRSRC